MEAVGVAASLVGIVAFVGQSIDGLGKLKAFFDDVKKAKKKISALLSDIDELQDMLLRVQRLGEVFNQDAANSLPASSLPDFSALQMNVEACGEDILIWVKAAQELDLGSAIGLRAFFQRARVAAEKALFEEFGRKIASHRQRIGLSLSVLGRSLDFLSQAKLDGLRLQFNTLTESHLKLHDAVTKEADAVPPPPQEEPLSEILAKAFRHQEAAIEDVIGELAERVSLDHLSTHKSIRSIQSNLSTINSSLTALTRGIGQSVTSDETDGHDISDLEEGINWTCDTLTGTDEAFIDDMCLFCSETFKVEDSFLRGKHLVDHHWFGKCNLDAKHQSWEGLKFHLKKFHKLAFSNTTRETLRLIFRGGRSRPYIFRQRDGRSHKSWQPSRHKDEEANRAHALQESLASSLRQAGHLDYGYEASPRLGRTWLLAKGLSSLARSALSSKAPCEPSLNTLYQTLCTEEQMVVQDMDSTIFYRRPLECDAVKQHLDAKYGVRKQRSGWYSKGWKIVQPPDHFKLDEILDEPLQDCEDCTKGKLYSTVNFALKHIYNDHLNHTQSFTSSLAKFGRIPLVEELFMRLDCAPLANFGSSRSPHERISKWMRFSFLESERLRLLLKSCPETRNIVIPSSEEWLAAVLRAWDQSNDEALQFYSPLPSDGAVDSRDNLTNAGISSSVIKPRALGQPLKPHDVEGSKTERRQAVVELLQVSRRTVALPAATVVEETFVHITNMDSRAAQRLTILSQPRKP